MRRAYFAVCVLLSIAACSGMSSAWDHIYDGSVLPNDPSLGSNVWLAAGDTSACSSDGSVLRILDRTDTYVSFRRSAAPARSPLTVEARVRVVSGNNTLLYVGTPSYTPYLELYADRVQINFGSGRQQTYHSDLSVFHTIRLDMDAWSRSYVWLDDVLAAQGTSTPGGNTFDLMFGAPFSGASESYWDYVAYSAAFLPIPEPSSLLALAGGLAGIVGAGMWRRRRGAVS